MSFSVDILAIQGHTLSATLTVEVFTTHSEHSQFDNPLLQELPTHQVQPLLVMTDQCWPSGSGYRYCGCLASLESRLTILRQPTAGSYNSQYSGRAVGHPQVGLSGTYR